MSPAGARPCATAPTRRRWRRRRRARRGWAVVVPGGRSAAAAHKAAEKNEHEEEAKAVTLRDVLGDATKAMPGDRAASGWTPRRSRPPWEQRGEGRRRHGGGRRRDGGSRADQRELRRSESDAVRCKELVVMPSYLAATVE
ncbi:hypothetical protein HU200_008973 [Digitaria exilis]|uniref:Uncharacterized protein n=1 Tax=Digitaria exilis TaxID=1010633 RepID=A0A835FJW0_9POAL|nr:hypothetical protein HU200_008973 [Digitaria exilis]